VNIENLELEATAPANAGEPFTFIWTRVITQYA
jgi:hypothetical protein